ncbi:MAG TPA: hypothetical protein VFQ71_14610 [Gaiellales bacterium]|nr:hypothetical protein [Gaiellales bacterium]
MSTIDRRGLREVCIGWAVFVVFLPVTVATYARLPPGGTYNFDATGVWQGGLGRTLVELGYPVALGAIGLAAVAGRGRPRLAALAIVLSATAGLPGVVSQDDLTARWVNVPAAAGVLLALGLAVDAAVRAGGTSWAADWVGPRDAARLAIAAVALVWVIPWIVASLGFYVSDVPLLGHVFRAAEPTPGEPGLASVHRGLHEGLAGVQLALTALLLSRALPIIRSRGREWLGAYLSVMLVYGVMVALGDGWNEQLVKRGVTTHMPPNVLTPKLDWGWALLILLAAAVDLLWFRPEVRARARSTASAGSTTAEAPS